MCFGEIINQSAESADGGQLPESLRPLELSPFLVENVLFGV